MKAFKKLNIFIFLLASLISFNSIAQTCSASSYDFKNIFPKAWINQFCSQYPCGQSKYQTMLNDFHNIFPMTYLLTFHEKTVEVEAVSLSSIAYDESIEKNKSNYSGDGTKLSSHMQKMYENLIQGKNTVPSITRKSVIQKEIDKDDNFFCYLQLNTRVDLYKQTRGEGRGVVARTILYMIDQYDIKSIPTFLTEDYSLLRSWDKKYLPTAEECNRNSFIKRKQGNDNKYITMGCLARSL